VAEDFWETAEERIYAALRDYSEHAENGSGFQRRLFAEDAASGFAFIDLCRRRYDVALMNPPFGEFASDAKDYLDSKFFRCNSDYYPSFVERALGILSSSGCMGAITNRTGFYLGGLANWRRQFYGTEGSVTVFADLGRRVLAKIALPTQSVSIFSQSGLNFVGTQFRGLQSNSLMGESGAVFI
jgi:hypothetical protein